MTSMAAATFDAAAQASEQAWGVDRLQALVPEAMAIRFGAALAAMNAAIEKDDPDETAAMAQNCVRGLAAMDAAARAAGHIPVPPEAWPFGMDGVNCVLVRDASLWPTLPLSMQAMRVYTMPEVINALRHYGGMVASAKDTFPGATVTAIRERTKTEVFLDDEIPY